MEAMTFAAPLERDKDGTWWYVHVPAEIRSHWRHLARRGFIKVTATVGRYTWAGSLVPWADGSAQLSIGRDVREREQLDLGDEVTVRLVPVGSSEPPLGVGRPAGA
jgi:hypothetical protein